MRESFLDRSQGGLVFFQPVVRASAEALTITCIRVGDRFIIDSEWRVDWMKMDGWMIEDGVGITCPSLISVSKVWMGSIPGKSSMSPVFMLKQAPCQGQRTVPFE